jgi:ribosomal protein S27AE
MTPTWLNYYRLKAEQPNRYFNGRCPRCGTWTNAKNENSHYANCHKKIPAVNISKKSSDLVKRPRIALQQREAEDHSKDWIYLLGLIMVVFVLMIIFSGN